MSIKSWLLRLIFPIVVIAVAACAPMAAPDKEPNTSQGDAPALVATVVAGVQEQLRRPAQASPSDENANLTDKIVREVLATLEPRLASSKPIVRIENQVGSAASNLELQDQLIALYQRANPAVVFIITSLGSGSGFVYDARGHIVTNNHVVEDASNYEIVFADGQRRPGKLVGRDVDGDLAVLSVADMPDGIDPLPLAQGDDVQVGQFVVAIGNPFGEQGSMSLGIVSGLDRSLRSQRTVGGVSSYSLPQIIQTDAPINPGNSGGPLLNLDGEVVGVNSAIASTTGANSGVGFSIPVAAVRRIVPALIKDGEYVYPYLGISFANDLTLDERETLGLSGKAGAYVIGIANGGPADLAGLIAADPNTGRGGDLVIGIDDQPVNDFSDLNSYLIFHTTAGQTVEITALRNGKQVKANLTLGARP